MLDEDEGHAGVGGRRSERENASSPPADAPMPTVRNMAVQDAKGKAFVVLRILEGRLRIVSRRHFSAGRRPDRALQSHGRNIVSRYSES
jgi:hypothetical protein